jgi:hypothetical protein
MQHYQEIFRGTHQLRAALLGLMFGLASGQAGADELCTTSASSASAIDGIVAPGVSSGSCAADTLWPGVGPAAFQPSGSNPEAYLRIARITSGNRLRIGIDVAGDDDVSNFDAVLLFFDANNNNAWDNADFAVRIFVSPSDTAINSGEACNLATGDIEYFAFNSGDSTWVPDEAAAALITARYAYDYTSPDPEGKVWNLEFDFPINGGGDFQLTTSGDYFAAGGYVFADDGHQQSPQIGSVRAWPSAVVSALTGMLPDISFSFSPLQVTAPAPNLLGNIILEDVCFDVNFSQHNWQINGIESESGDNHLNRTGNNRFRVGYYFDGPGSNPTPISNPGTVRMTLTPYRAGGPTSPWITDIDVDATPYNYNQLHMTDEKVLNFPGEFGSTANIDFICAKLNLVGFDLDDDTSNNSSNINHNYFITSSYRQTVELSAAGIPDLQPGQSSKVWMKVDNNNEHPEVSNFIRTGLAGSGAGAGSCTPGLPVLILAAIAVILLLALLFTGKAGWKKAGWIVWILLLLLLVWLYCQNRGGQGHVGTPRFSITNAAELGIKPLAGKPGWYEMPIAHGETKQLQMHFQGQPLPYKPERLRLQAAVDGAPGTLDIPVTPGQVLTVIATGQVDLDGEQGPLPPTMAGGFTLPRQDGSADAQAGAAAMKKFHAGRVPYTRTAEVNVAAATAAERPGIGRYPLTEGYYQPQQFAGALAGWFHGQEASSGTFVIGRATSIVVPDGVDTLTVFVNAPWASYLTIAGFYDLVLVNTQAPTVPTRTVPGGDATYRLPLQLPPWMVLTSINLYTYFPQVLVQQGVDVGTTLLPLGDAHFSIYDSHAETFDANAIATAAGIGAAVNR